MDLDLVIPAHNEEHRIERTLDAYRAHEWGRDVRFIVALDDCTDRTAAIVARHRREDPRVEMSAYPKLGKGGVIMEAFRRCRAELVGFVDADCATPPSEMSGLAGTAERADGAIASRRHASSVLPAPRTATRRLMSAGFAFATRRLFGLPFTDTQCGAKVFHRDAVERALPMLSSRDLLFDVDLLLTLRALDFEVIEVPTVWIDRDGSRMEPVSDARRMAASALRLWLHHRVIPVQSPTGSATAGDDRRPEHPSRPRREEVGLVPLA